MLPVSWLQKQDRQASQSVTHHQQQVGYRDRAYNTFVEEKLHVEVLISKGNDNETVINFLKASK